MNLGGCGSRLLSFLENIRLGCPVPLLPLAVEGERVARGDPEMCVVGPTNDVPTGSSPPC